MRSLWPSESSRSDPPGPPDLDSPIPGTWGLVAVLAAVHLSTAAFVTLAGRAPWWAALFLERSVPFRVDMGGQAWGRVAEGEGWRLATSVLLHADALHLAVNAVALFGLGRVLEPWVGARRLLAWFALGGLAGSLTSQAVGVALSDGASGGAFALFGAVVVLSRRAHPNLDAHERRILGPVLWGFLVLNLVLSFALPFIDAAGHLGGLGAGLLLAGVAHREGRALQVAEALAIGAFAGLCAYGWW